MITGIQSVHHDIQNFESQHSISQTGKSQPVIQVPDILLAGTQASNIQPPDTQTLDIGPQDDQPPEMQPLGVQLDIQSTDLEVASVVNDGNDIPTDQTMSDNVSGI